MSEINFGNIEDVIGFDDYIEKRLAENEKEIDKLKQELQGMNELLKSYRKTIKHDAELLADATRNGYLPPLDDIVRKSEIKDAWKQRTEKRWNDE